MVPARDSFRYLTGLGNEQATEAVAGALPQGRNAPQRPPLGLYAEQLSGTSFTAPRHANRRSWLYRILPSAIAEPFRRIDNALWRSAPFGEAEPSPNRLRWNPLPLPAEPTDFIDGMATMGGNGDVGARAVVALHLYRPTKSMTDRVFSDADG